MYTLYNYQYDLLRVRIELNDPEAQLMIMRWDKDFLENSTYDFLHVAVVFDNSEVIDTLLAKGLKSGFAMDEAIKKNNTPMIDKFIAHDMKMPQTSFRRGWDGNIERRV